MHILCHARIGCFGGISLSEVIAGGKAGLQRIVAFPLCVEQRCAYTCIQTEPGVYIEIVFGVKGDFLSAHGMAVAGIVNRIFLEGAIIYILYFEVAIPGRNVWWMYSAPNLMWCCGMGV